MGAVYGALAWALGSILGVLLSAVALILGATLLALLPGLVFLSLAVKADWSEVQAVRAADPAHEKLLEDSESLIPGGDSSSSSSAALELGVQLKTEQPPKNSPEAQTDAGTSTGEAKDVEAEAEPLNATQKADKLDQGDVDFAATRQATQRTDKPSSLSAAAAYGRRVVVIIPSLNEESALAATLDRLNSLHPPVSLILVADGGSTDGTPRVAQEKGAVLVPCPAMGRAGQMNAGAREASKRMREEDDREGAAGMLEPVAGDSILAFVPPGSRPPTGFVNLLQGKFAEPSTCCVGLVPLVSVPGRVFWVFSLLDSARAWLFAMLKSPRGLLKGLRLLTLSQTLSCCSRDFFRVGGFDEGLAMSEDADLCERLHSEAGMTVHGAKVCLVPRLVVASGSGRSVAKQGQVKALERYLRFAWACVRRAPPEELQALS